MKFKFEEMRILEEVAMNAWPALEQILYDGWVLRFSNDFTGRANSVNPLYRSTIDIKTKISTCKEIYRKKDLKARFRLTAFFTPKSLDQVLEKLGFIKSENILVMSKPLEKRGLGYSRGKGEIKIVSIWEWIQAYYLLNQEDKKYLETHYAMLQRITNPVLPALFKQEGETVACGFGVLERKFFGLFNIYTHKAHRNKGVANKLIREMFEWAESKGAETSYLQVDESNIVARNLYKKIGFNNAYPYWYRYLSD